MNAPAQIIQFLLEENDPTYNAVVDFSERVDLNRSRIMREFLSLPPDSTQEISWNKVRAARLKRIWLDFGKSRVVRDEKGLEEIANQVLENIARIKAVTELVGHESYGVEDFLEEEGIELTPEQWQRFYDSNFITNQFSDYAMKPLENLYVTLHKAQTAEEKLYAIDRILNVVHQRGDIADLFVEGGSSTLQHIFNQGGYTSEGIDDDEDFDQGIGGELELEPYESEFLNGYIEALFFTDQDQFTEDLEKRHEEGELLDFTYDKLELSSTFRQEIEMDCQKFERENAEDIGTSLVEAGRDFWFTRNGHGVGFWDGDWPEPQATRLHEACKRFGEVWAYIGDDGFIYGSR